MEPTPPAVEELARRLIALETPRDDWRPEIHSDVARVCERLRVPFAKLAGQTGYRSLIARALAIVKSKAPGLDSIALDSDGSITGLAEVEKATPGSGIAIVEQLLNLLVTFIGEPVTVGLIRTGWPNAELEITPSNAKEKP